MSTGNSNSSFPQLTATAGFVCDICGEAIADTATAWGQWYTQHLDASHKTPKCWHFSIVHGVSESTSCAIPPSSHPLVNIGDLSLDFLLSADGLTYLLEFFAEREVDPEELARFLMRLFVPGYEQAHRHISAAIADGLHEPKCNRHFLTQGEITRIVEGHREGRFGTCE